MPIQPSRIERLEWKVILTNGGVTKGRAKMRVVGEWRGHRPERQDRHTQHLRGGDINLVCDDAGQRADHTNEYVDVAIEECICPDEQHSYEKRRERHALTDRK